MDDEDFDAEDVQRFPVPDAEFDSWMDQQVFNRLLEEFNDKYEKLWNFANDNGIVHGYLKEF